MRETRAGMTDDQFIFRLTVSGINIVDFERSDLITFDEVKAQLVSVPF